MVSIFATWVGSQVNLLNTTLKVFAWQRCSLELPKTFTTNKSRSRYWTQRKSYLLNLWMCGPLTSSICSWVTQLITMHSTLSLWSELQCTSSTQKQSFVNLTLVRQHFTLHSLIWLIWLKRVFQRPTGRISPASMLSYQVVAPLQVVKSLIFPQVPKSIKSILISF